MSETFALAHKIGTEFLHGRPARHTAADDIRTASFSSEIDFEISDRALLPVRKDLLLHDQAGTFPKISDRPSVSIRDPAELCGFHDKAGVLLEHELRDGIEDLCAVALAVRIMLFDVAHLCVFLKMKRMDAVVSGIAAGIVVDAAPRNDGHVRICADVKVVVNSVLKITDRQ